MWRLNLKTSEKNLQIPSIKCSCPTLNNGRDSLYKDFQSVHSSTQGPHTILRDYCVFLRYICVLIKYVCVYVLVCVYIYHMFVGTLRGQIIPAPLNQELQTIESHSLGTKCRSSGSKWSYPLNHLPTSIRYHFLFCYPQELPISFSQPVFSSTHSSNSLPSFLLEHGCLPRF